MKVYRRLYKKKSKKKGLNALASNPKVFNLVAILTKIRIYR